MKKNILAFGASSSKTSINKELASYTANLIDDATVDLIDLNDYELPIYSVDKETENGISQLAQDFKQKIKDADGIIVSFAEHNGSFSAAYKNIYDWVSRIDANVWEGKPMFLLATSPGARGGGLVLETAFNIYSYANPNIIGKFSLPSFYDNYKDGISNAELSQEHGSLLEKFKEAL